MLLSRLYNGGLVQELVLREELDLRYTRILCFINKEFIHF